MAKNDKDSIAYNGNENLSKINVKFNYTQEQLLEVAKCMKDPIYFAETYFKIISVDDGLVPFKLYDYQKEAVKLYMNHNKIILATSRQVGKTSVATVILLHYAMFNDNKRVYILANKADSAQDVLQRIQLAFEYLPLWLKPGIKEWNKTSIAFENGTIIKSASTSSDAIRGRSCNILYIDETAFIENWEEFSASVLPVISSGKTSKLIFTSTPKGLNHFYTYYAGAKKGTNGFKLIEVKWDEIPGRDEKWKEETLGTINHDMQKFAQEYCVEFIGSSGTLISGAKLKELIKDTENKLPEFTDSVMGYKVYSSPVPECTYIITVDTARGKGLDYSAFQVISTSGTPYEQSAVFRSNTIAVPDFASFIYNIAKVYNNAYLLIELNDIGGQVADIINLDYGYEYVLYTKNAGSKGKAVSSGFGGNKSDRGIRTTKTVKSLGCSMLKLLIEQDKLIINDKETTKELSTFSDNGKGSYEAEKGKHDDLVMCLVLFAWLTTDDFFKDITDENVMHSLRDLSDDQVLESMVPFGIIDSNWNDNEFDDVEDFGDGDVWKKVDSIEIW